MKKKIINLLKKLTRKTVLGALALAIALWFFTSLNETYTVRIEIPLSLQLPENRALEDEIPENITVETRGSGWNLFYLMNFNTDKVCALNLTDKVISDSLYNVSRSVLLSSIRSFEEVQSINIAPENITVKTGKIVKKFVPLEPNISIKTNDNFILVGDIKLEPDSIEITGNHKVIKRIKNWQTKHEILSDIKNDISKTIRLHDTLTGIVNISPEEVHLVADIQLLGDKTFYQIKLEITGGGLPSNFNIYPDLFDITVSGGVEELQHTVRENISVEVQLSDILNNETGIITPKVILPKGTKLKNVTPDKIFIFQHTDVNNINQIVKQ